MDGINHSSSTSHSYCMTECLMIWNGSAWVFPIRMGCVTILSPLRFGKVVPS
jgi:hypothetical protein